MSFFRFFALLGLAMLAACAQPQPRGPVVLAAASMQEALEEIARVWEADGHSAPVLSFAGTAALARQIEGGAPADVFVSADGEWMDELERGELIRSGTRTDIAGNSLVLVGDPDHWRDAFWDGRALAAMSEGARIAVADTRAVPAGRYARAALETMGEWDAVEPRLVPAENVRAALALVERGQTELGIVYATDARASRKVVTLGAFAALSAEPIRYPAAVLAASTHPDAEAFTRFLRSDEARDILAAHGFEPVS